MAEDRKEVYVRLFLGKCPVCRTKFTASAEVPYPLREGEREELMAVVQAKAEIEYEKHFAYHADEISDMEPCPDCLLLPKGHARCGEPECTCACSLET